MRDLTSDLKAKSSEEIIELIGRRRRQILVHSYIYYQLDKNLISDHTWSEWAVEMDILQKTYPEEAAKAPFNDKFEDFDPSSGYDLDFYDEWIRTVAYRLLDYVDKQK